MDFGLSAVGVETGGSAQRIGRAGFILEPELYVFALVLLGCDLCQLGGEVFLKAAMASASWA
jgi:hypothetical protein